MHCYNALGILLKSLMLDFSKPYAIWLLTVFIYITILILLKKKNTFGSLIGKYLQIQHKLKYVLDSLNLKNFLRFYLSNLNIF